MAIPRLLYAETGGIAAPFELIFHDVRQAVVPLHSHDFAELVWIQAGSCRHQVNGLETGLRPGDLLYIRAADVHGFRLVRGRPVKLVNLAFYPEALAVLVQHYGLGADPFWGVAPLPERMLHVPPALAVQVDLGLQELQAGAATALARDLLFLGLLRQVQQPAADPFAACPPWLAAGCRQMQEPRHFRGGVAALAQLCDRTPEHVSRVLRACTGRTPVEWVTRWRLQHAARRLRQGERNTAAVAYDCGFRSLGHFYQLFGRHFGQPPAQYRRRSPQHVFPLPGGAAT